MNTSLIIAYKIQKNSLYIGRLQAQKKRPKALF